MGTNYYLEVGVCKCCKRSKEQLHIGKSSGGWAFALHYDEERGLTSLEAWKKAFRNEDSLIKDEYGREVSTEEMIGTIVNRQMPKGDHLTREWLRDNHATTGSHNLAMANDESVVSRHGTYVLMKGWFS